MHSGGMLLRNHGDEKTTAKKYDDGLKGTFVTVIFIGIFILLSWGGIFYYYITTI